MGDVLSNVHYNGEQLVQPVGILGVFGRVGQAQLEGERYAVKELGVAPEGFLVLEPLQVKREDVWEALDFHSDQRGQWSATHLFSASCRPQQDSQ